MTTYAAGRTPCPDCGHAMQHHSLRSVRCDWCGNRCPILNPSEPSQAVLDFAGAR